MIEHPEEPKPGDKWKYVDGDEYRVVDLVDGKKLCDTHWTPGVVYQRYTGGKRYWTDMARWHKQFAFVEKPEALRRPSDSLKENS